MAVGHRRRSLAVRFSIAFAPDEAPVVRFLVEAQGGEPTLASTRDAALDLTRRLTEHGVDLTRFDRIRDLFLPPVPNARFALWHAARLSGGPEVKAYFNPQNAGKERSFELVESAMRTLGFESAWPALLQAAQRRTSDDEIRYFALDLAGGGAARVKVYLPARRHHGAPGADGGNPPRLRGELTEFCARNDGKQGSLSRIPARTYLLRRGRPLPPRSRSRSRCGSTWTTTPSPTHVWSTTCSRAVSRRTCTTQPSWRCPARARTRPPVSTRTSRSAQARSD